MQFQYIQLLLRFIIEDGDDDLAPRFTIPIAKAGEEVEEWANNHDGARVEMERTVDGVFKGLALFPTACTFDWTYMRRLIMLDVAHLSAAFEGVILLATGVDADESTIVLGWAIVKVESMDTWSWFFDLINVEILQVLDASVEEGLAILSDRQKGLGPAIQKHFPQV